MYNVEADRKWWADRCKRSMWWCARRAFNIDGNPKGGWLVERIHKPLCDWFQFHCEEWLDWRRKGIVKQKHLMVCLAREAGKTTLLTNSGSIWLQLQDPELGIAIGSETIEKAEKWFKPIPQVISGEDKFSRFANYYGSWKEPGRQWSKSELVHAAVSGTSARDPSFATFGVRTGLSGWRPDIIIMDDPISYEIMDEDAYWCDKVNSHASSHIPVLKRNGMRIYILTPYEDNDLWTRQLELHGAKTVTGLPIPSITPMDNGLYDVYYMPGKTIDGEPTMPEIWSKDRMTHYERDNPRHFYAQVLCAPYNDKTSVLTRAHTDPLWVEPHDVPRNLRISLHFDTAFKHPDRRGRGDDSVIATLGHARDGSGELYFLGAWASDQADVLDFKNKLIITLQDLEKRNAYPFAITDENSQHDKAGVWQLTLQGWCHGANLPLPPLTLIVRQGKAKTGRLIEAASYWRAGKFKLVRGAPEAQKLVTQMLTIGRRGGKDDVADAVADGFNPAVYHPEQRASAREDLPFDNELKPNLSYATVRQRFLRGRNTEEFDENI